jgi:Fe-S cluster assembly protein SufD
MIAEKTNTAEQVIQAISRTAGKVSFIKDDVLAKALMNLENKGFPTNKTEDYKYCNIDAILKKDFKNLAQKFSNISSAKEFALEDAVTLMVVNGNYSPALSDKVILKGLHIDSFDRRDPKEKIAPGKLADVESDAFIALNTAFSGNGFHLKIERNEVLRMPIHIVYVNAAEGEALVNPRNIIQLGENSEAIIIEHFVYGGKGKIFSNFLSEKILAENAKLNSFIIQDESQNGFSVNTNQVDLARYAKYDNTTITISGQLVRNNHNVVLSGQYSEAHLYGLFITSGTQLVDNHTLMDHQVPDCESNELYKGIIDEKSTGVFNGKIFVRKDAQKTNAYQSSKNILLSDDGTINTKPQLEIYADDVKCSHGTSTGKIDEEALFYLKARGIGETAARKILLNAFAGEVIDKIETESLKALVEEKLGFN